MLNQERLQKLQALAQREEIGAFVVVPSASLVYLAGFNMGLSERPAFLLVPQKGEVVFLCPAFEAERVRDARPYLAELRMAKDAEEQAYMQTAAQAADLMVAAIERKLAPGVSERELQEAAIEALKEAYPEAEVPFISIASGERTALPHAGTTDRRVEDGDLVWVDLGARINGYVSDITRTFALGPLDEELERAYDLVLAANRAACQAAKPGVTAEYLDEVARAVIREGGFGEQFTHRTGHGIGLEVHEEPYIVAGNQLVMQPGYAFTIEPGIYLPGKGGIRIEDDVVITETGAKILTAYRRDLRDS